MLNPKHRRSPIINLTLDAATHERLNELAAWLNVSRSGVVREAVRKYHEAQRKVKRPPPAP